MTTANTAQITYSDYLRYCDFAKVDPFPQHAIEGSSLHAVMLRRVVAQWLAANA
jgi:hypothetical protein